MNGAPAGTPRIAIVGGGIGGLAAAAFLGRAGLPSIVYEQARELTEVGAGLVDVVIGADGIHSVIRGSLGEAAPPVFSGPLRLPRTGAGGPSATIRPPPRANTVDRARSSPGALSHRRWEAREPRRLRASRGLLRRVVDGDRDPRRVPRRVRRLGFQAHRPDPGCRHAGSLGAPGPGATATVEPRSPLRWLRPGWGCGPLPAATRRCRLRSPPSAPSWTG